MQTNHCPSPPGLEPIGQIQIHAPLGMAYVPMQKLECLYNPMTALQRGTLFAALDLPWLAHGGNADE